MGVIIYGMSLICCFSQNHLNWAAKIIKRWIDIIFKRTSTAFISTDDFSRMTIRIDRADTVWTSHFTSKDRKSRLVTVHFKLDYFGKN